MKKMTTKLTTNQNPEGLDSDQANVQSGRHASRWTWAATNCRASVMRAAYQGPTSDNPLAAQRIGANHCGGRQNPDALDSGFWLDNQNDRNQRLSADSRIQKILTRILRILAKTQISCGFPANSRIQVFTHILRMCAGYPADAGTSGTHALAGIVVCREGKIHG